MAPYSDRLPRATLRGFGNMAAAVLKDLGHVHGGGLGFGHEPAVCSLRLVTAWVTVPS